MRIALSILLVACGHHPPTDITTDDAAVVVDVAVDGPERTNRCTGEGAPLRFELAWQGDADLDLHVVQGPRDTRLCASFSDCYAGNPMTYWDGAWSSTPGAETVTLASTIPGDYNAYVHAKTGTATDVTVRVTTFLGMREVKLAQLAAGSVWGAASAWFYYDYVDCGEAFVHCSGSQAGVIVPDTGLCTMPKWSFPWESTSCL